ncbi:hypothetical protein Phi10:1_gp074 [Cellulophaga phage phi10:1]|uniref:Uncharacterized protein n=1 Tax=Cellulophaga phage phi10:1 TaxID=1327981 RepID=S0A0S9_9CAUD|nr:hypothetical protein Phi10:1_gp074 [Cellulophaga phage phi10:1]AGO48415.1 hypothetical protein Phi10:1_gp074 [Cellulophaga phage phi10:1]
MNANELRKGIYVRDRGGKEMLIDYIDMPNNKVGMNMLVMGIPVHPLTEFIDYLQPIPLTEEWLLKFGFKRNEPYCFIGIKKRIQLINIGNKYFRLYYYNTSIKIDIAHVHQLQNLYFALTGEELIKTN